MNLSVGVFFILALVVSAVTACSSDGTGSSGSSAEVSMDQPMAGDCQASSIKLQSGNVQSGEQNVFRGITLRLMLDSPVVNRSGVSQAVELTANQPLPPSDVALGSNGQMIQIFFDELLPNNAEVSLGIDMSMLAGCTAGDSVEQITFRTADTRSLANTLACGQVLASEVELDTAGNRVEIPIESAAISFAGGDATTTSDADGFFCLRRVPAGEQMFVVDARDSINSQEADGYYPRVVEQWFIADSGATNVGTVYLPLIPSATLTPVDPAAESVVMPAAETIRTFPAMARAQLSVPAGAVSSNGGEAAVSLGIAAVDPRRLPAPLPADLQFPLVITVQASADSRFIDPVGVCLPNLPDPETGQRIDPGARAGLWSFNHEKGNFEVVGQVEASADGQSVCSIPGDGLLYPGWHAVSPRTFLDWIFPNPNTVNDPGFDACSSDTYARLLDESYSQDVIDGVNNVNGTFQPVGDSLLCLYCDTAFDEYQVEVRLPEDVSPNDILKMMLGDLNGFIEHSGAEALSLQPFGALTDAWEIEFPDLFRLINEFSFRPPADPANPQPGDVVEIDFGILFIEDSLYLVDEYLFNDLIPDSIRPQLENFAGKADVVLSRLDLDNPQNGHWAFTTITTPENSLHPVSGSREFGFEKNDDGTVTFYTRGVDSPTIFGAQWGATAQFTGWQSYIHSLAGKLKNEFGADITGFDNSTRYLDEPPNCPSSAGRVVTRASEARSKGLECEAYSYHAAISTGLDFSSANPRIVRSSIYGVARYGEQVPLFLPPDSIAELYTFDIGTGRYGRSLVALESGSSGQVSFPATLTTTADENGNSIPDMAELTSGALTGAFGAVYFHDGASRLGAYDPQSGVFRFVGNLQVGLSDIAFSPSGQLFGVSEDTLYRINRNNASAQAVGQMGFDGVVALEFDSVGRLFAATRDGQLLAVDAESGLALGLGSIGFESAGDLAISRSGELFMTTRNDELVRIAPDDVATSLEAGASLVGPIGVEDVFGLAFDAQGRLIAFSGSSAYSVDPATATAELLGNYQGLGIGPAFGAAAEQNLDLSSICLSE